MKKAREQLAEYEKKPMKESPWIWVETVHTASGARFGHYWKRVET